MKIPLVDLKAQHKKIQSELAEAFESVLEQTAFINGPFLKNFENSFSKLMGAKNAVGVGSGTIAIELACRALKLGLGDEVIVPANTYVATAAAIVSCGATPVFADVKEEDFHIDLEQAKKLVTKNTKAIIPVHLFGLACEMENLSNFAKEHDIHLINDAAQAHLSTFKSEALNSFAKLTCWSFYPGKNLGALGDAGAVTGNDEALCRQVRLLSDQGSQKKYHHEVVGGTHRLDALQAAFLSVKLNHLESWTKLRQQKAVLYNELLSDLDVIVPRTFNDRDHVYHLYVIRVSERDRVLKSLNEQGVYAGIHYPFALTETPSMEPWVREPCPVAEKLSREILSLPLYPEITDEQQEFVVNTLKGVL